MPDPIISNDTAFQMLRSDHALMSRALRAETIRPEEPAVLGSSWEPWTPRALYGLLDGTHSTTRPTILKRTDGKVALIYPGKTHAFAGEPESGKTMAALAACAEEMDAGRDVLYLDFEDDAREVVERLAPMMEGPHRLVNLFHYVRPFEALEEGWLDRLVTQYRPTLAIVDGVTEAMALHGLKIKENDDAAGFDGLIGKPLTRAGVAVVYIDHVTKSKDSRGRYALGAQHKLAAISGAFYTFEVLSEMAPGKRGEAKIRLSKDKPGGIRSVVEKGSVGTLVVDGTNGLSVTLEMGRAPSTSERVSDILSEHGALSTSALGQLLAEEPWGEVKPNTLTVTLKRLKCEKDSEGLFSLLSPTGSH